MKAFFNCIIIMCMIAVSVPAHSQSMKKLKMPKKQTNHTWDVFLGYENTNSAAFFNMNSKLTSILPDSSFDGTSANPIPDYTFELNKYSTVIKAKYTPSSEISFAVKIPFSFYTLDERYTADSDSNNVRQDKDYKNYFQIDYVSFAAEYILSDSKLKTTLTGEMRVPTSNYSGVIGNKKLDFGSDGAFELYAGTKLFYVEKNFNTGLTAQYNYRAEDLSDRLIVAGKFALSSVPGTEISATGTFSKSIESWDNVSLMNSRIFPTHEDYFDMGLSFMMYFSENLYCDFNYAVRLWGKNTWNYGGVNIGVGYSF